MKLNNLYAIAICCTVALSCSDDTDERSLSGSWNLTNATTTEGTNLNYSQGEVIWSFSERNNTLSIQNRVITLGPENTFAGPATGNYHFSVQRQQGMDYLYVDGTRIGALANTGNNLVINSNEENGIIKVFSR
jgi:hypothetical protein